MEKTLQQMITPEQMVSWLIIAFLVGYFIYKEWPEFKRRVSGSAVKEVADKSVGDRLTAIEEDVKQIKEKLDRDYGRINDMERWKKSMEQMVQESLEEREILMTSMLSMLMALKKMGADGTTDEAIDTIQKYINKQAHKRETS